VLVIVIARQEYYPTEAEELDEQPVQASSPDTPALSMERFRGFSFINVDHLAKANQMAFSK
jgi:hypothetical protein